MYSSATASTTKVFASDHVSDAQTFFNSNGFKSTVMNEATGFTIQIVTPAEAAALNVGCFAKTYSGAAASVAATLASVATLALLTMQ